ncbi:MAG: HAD family phosphatase [Lachnospiraceae bacterium]|nr:HAD family phosphatase [Lachnospiraceae bacterium]
MNPAEKVLPGSRSGIGRPAGVIFDLDGVIIDSEGAVLRCWDAAMERLGLPLPEGFRETCLSVIGSNRERTREVFLERYGPDLPYDRISQEKIRAYRDLYGSAGVPLKPGVRELLSVLEEEGIPAAVASSTPTEIVREELAAEDILRFFRTVVGGDQVSRSKPAPDIFLRAAELLGVAPERALVLEDSYNGVRAAHAGGIPVIMVPDLLPATDEMYGKAAAVLGSLDDVRRALEPLC